ncbi:PH domain-containing protein [Halosegnis longus]|uniref:PH domain-containing protein n=1 Tax=Halosegnis longus TaxID=2216012 RepID=UPI00129E88E6|nr:PH domain-containing protein [Halosegnis longus]
MGIFSSGEDDDVDDSVEELITNAAHDSVTEERLTKLKPGRMSRYLHDDPLVEYLNEGEQPHFILAARNKGPSVSGSSSLTMPEKSGTGMTMYLITDDRWLTVTANQNGDQTLDVSLDDIDGVEYELGGVGAHEISIGIADSQITFPIANIYDDDDIEAVSAYLFESTRATPEDGIEIAAGSPDEAPDVSSEAEPNDEAASNSADDYAEQIANATGDIRAEDLAAIEEYLDPDEQVHYILRGASISIEGGNSDDRKGSLTGTVRSAVTDRRVLTVVPQKLMGDDTKSLAYEDMGGVDFNKGLATKYLKIQSHGRTYEINTRDAENTKAAKDFIRQRKSEVRDENQSAAGSSPDPTEQLKNIKELHDAGVLSDEEFEEKKTNLLDKI